VGDFAKKSPAISTSSIQLWFHLSYRNQDDC
jgi:hypothetical protein